MAGDRTWLDNMNAEISTDINSSFTCRGKQGDTGGSNMDYFIISKCLVPLVKYCGAVFDAPLGPALRSNVDVICLT